MRQEDYVQIKDALEKAGFFASIQSYVDEDVHWRIVPVSHRTEGRLHGNSFWLSLEEGKWRLVAWVPVEYLVPAEADLTALCFDCLRASATPIRVVPSEIVSRYRLQELTQDESDRG